MHDGMGRKLDCWYVPDLWKNLISLDTLSKDGMKYFGERDWLTFSKDALVFMRAKLQHGIYFMEGCTTRGTMAISQSLDQYNDKKELCHHRLRHINEKGMSILSIHGLFGRKVTKKLKPCEPCIK